MFRFLAAILAAVVLVAATSPAARAADCTIDGFRAGFNHRIPADAWIVYDAETDPNQRLGRPGFYVEKASWHDARLAALDGRAISSDTGGTIEIFTSRADLERRRDFLAAFDGTIFAAGYRYARGLVLVRASLDYTPDQAAEFEDILANC